MNTAFDEPLLNSTHSEAIKSRFPAIGDKPTILTDIYQEEINIAVWQRSVSARLKRAVGEFINSNPKF